MNPMIQWALLLGMNALLMAGWWKLFEKGMILGWLADWLGPKLPEYVQKPLYDCMACMSSIYGTAFFFLSPLASHPIYHWPLHCLMLCALGSLLQRALTE